MDAITNDVAVTDETTTKRRGRGPSKENMRVYTAVERAILKMGDEFTKKDLKKRVVGADNTTFNNAVNKMLRVGVIKQIGSKPTGGRGRPMSILARV